MKKSFSRFAFTLFFASALLLIVGACIVKKGDDVFFINGNHSPLLDEFFSFITVLGEGVLFLPFIIYLLFVQFRYSILALVVWIGHAGLCAFIKRGLFSNLSRPVSVLDNSLLHFVPDVDVHTRYSFPSGHTATIFCLAILMALIIKKKTPAVILLFIALLVGYSRIYLLQHFLIDVAGGATVGIGFTYLMWKLFESNSMPRWMNNSIKLNQNYLTFRNRKEAEADA
ncbi:MAG TPA: phosphatase PAP2 family protein [Cyclobacteriaceae bacterium]|nr:phosphatase PAP2 family protein [Cyclobacteriaceae bacterium]